MRKSMFVVIAVLAASIAMPASAGAHAAVTGRTPAPGAALRSVRSVKITFSESVVTGKLTVSRSGKKVGAGLLVNHNRGINANFTKALSKGTYVVAWSAVADDGHRESGTWSFRIA